MNKKELRELAIKDLERSGLDSKDFTKMRLSVHNEDEASIILNSSFATYGYTLPYFDINGKPNEAVRFRFLQDLKNDKNKTVKYSQPKGSQPRLYFPPCIKWKSILSDTKQVITFTEGEKKAYKASKEGIPTIGLGGVWSFKSKKLRKNLIDDFKAITLQGRKVILCFDNDSQSNEDVMKALRAFAKELSNEGAEVVIKQLPFNPYQKIGLDDYLLENTVADFHALPEDVFEELEGVEDFNDEVAYIRNVGKYYIKRYDLWASKTALINEVFANRTVMGENGQNVPTIKYWTEWPQRREHNKLTYEPGQPEVTSENNLNLWSGWGCKPKQGSVKPFMDAVRKIFRQDEELISWFLDWVAYPIQHPGTKMLSAVLLQSVYQGTGKSSIGLCIGAMYGRNFSVINDRQLHAPFNEWAINKQFILGDEVSGKDKRSDSDFIKNLVTQETITINKKYNPTYDIQDCMNYLLTSNHVDAWYLETDDRRAFVHDIDKDNALTLQDGMRLEKFRKGEGKQHLLHYFAYEHQLSKGFNHRARPPMTEAKANMIDHSLTDIERFLQYVKENPDYALTIGEAKIDRDLFTTTQVISLYLNKFPKANVTLTAMGKALNKIFPESDNMTIRTKYDGTKKVRALRNVEKWKHADHEEKRKHFEKSKIAMFDSLARKSKMKVVK